MEAIYTEKLYPKLIAYAYNIVGCYEDANDIVQDVFERYILKDKSEILSEKNYLIRSVINQSINFKKKHQRFSKYGVWLPEPISTEQADRGIQNEQIANYSILVLFEELSVKERAVFVLKEGFNYKHTEIADVLSIHVDSSRQLLTRAKKKMQNVTFQKKRQPKSCLEPYINALVTANVKKLEQLFADDICLMADGGDKVQVLASTTKGKNNTIMLLQQVYRKFLQNKNYVITHINHQPALCFFDNDKIISCMVFNFEGEKLHAIYSIVNPDKLKSLKFRNEVNAFKTFNNWLKTNINLN